MLLYACLLIGLVSAEETVSIEVDAETGETQAVKHPNSLEVIFENQSGKNIELYWDDNLNGVLQSELTHTSQITINTFIGHRFYFTPENSNGSKSNILYEIIMEEHTGLITLYNEQIMSERGAEFEREKNMFMKEYYEKNARKWLNYYPRNPVTHFMHNFTNIGQQIKVQSSHNQFTECDIDVIEAVSDTIVQQQTEQDTITNENENMNKTMPDFFRAETDNFEVIFMRGADSDANHAYFCRNKNLGLIDLTINVICTGPKVAYFENFLSAEECKHIQYIGTSLGLKRSTVSEEALTTEDRTSSTVWVERRHSPIIDEIVRRIADVVYIDESKLYLNQSSESLQLVHYLSGQLYKSHVDYGTDRPHNRYVTFLMYLNDVGGSGGNTSFPRAPKECRDENNYMGIHPKQGRVAFFYDLFSDGNVDELTQHYAEPPTEGYEKWMTNLWIWDAVFTR